jgi:23S rRNA (adenine1618-N6)-methyltransferase
VVSRSPEDSLIPLDDLDLQSIDFTMTNPPFYTSEEELVSSAKKKQRPPYTACTGSKTEMVTSGGELAFVGRVLAESCALRDRVQWYSAMFGFLSSLTEFIEQLRASGVENYAVTEFVQGNKTRRWAIAWSFQPMRPAQHVARGTRAALSKNILPLVNEADVLSLGLGVKIGELASRITEAIESLDLISWEWDKQGYEGTGRAADKVWARAWRRRKKRAQEETVSNREPICTFGFKVWIRVSLKEVVVGCRWVEGFDVTAFESFQGFLKSTARTAGTD